MGMRPGLNLHYQKRHGGIRNYRGQQARQQAVVAKQHRAKLLVLQPMGPREQKGQASSVGPPPLGLTCLALYSQNPFFPAIPSPMDTNLNRNDDPRLGLLPVIYQAPLLPHQYQHFGAVPALAVLLSTPKHWECPITDKRLALVCQLPIPKNLTTFFLLKNSLKTTPCLLQT